MSIRRQIGISLIELVLYIAIVSVGIAGILSVMNVTAQHSADPMVNKQALAVAESLLEEVLLKEYDNPAGGYSGADRTQFDDVDDYNGYTMTGISDIGGSPIAALSAYNASVAVLATTLSGVAAKLVTVTVTGPGGASIALSGYRTDYAP
ncbi:MAG: pilus assembly protein MshD [Pseudomonadota bacterium]